MPNTPRSDAASSELETRSDNKPSTPTKQQSQNNSEKVEPKTEADKGFLKGPNGEHYQPREKHWALTEWLARKTFIGSIGNNVSAQFQVSPSNSSSKENSATNSRNPSPSTGPRS